MHDAAATVVLGARRLATIDNGELLRRMRKVAEIRHTRVFGINVYRAFSLAPWLLSYFRTRAPTALPGVVFPQRLSLSACPAVGRGS
jgi:hypothetical protein